MRLIEAVVAETHEYVGLADAGVTDNQDFHKPVVGIFGWGLLHRGGVEWLSLL